MFDDPFCDEAVTTTTAVSIGEPAPPQPPSTAHDKQGKGKGKGKGKGGDGSGSRHKGDVRKKGHRYCRACATQKETNSLSASAPPNHEEDSCFP